MNISNKKTCRACGYSSEQTQSFSVHSFVPSFCGKFFRCANCGTETVETGVDYSRLYSSRDSSNYPASNGFLVKIKKLLMQRTVAATLDGYELQSRVLDFGCGGGELANAIYANGFVSVFAADVQADRPLMLDKNVTYLNVKDLNDHGLFNIILLRHVIEHLEFPVETLLQVRELMAEGSTMIVEFPSAHSFWKRVMGSRWTGYFFPYHTMVLSEEGARRVFKLARLRVKSVRKAEPPIFGVYLMSLGMPRSIARAFSGLLFPIQAMLSKITGCSEALVFELSR